MEKTGFVYLDNAATSFPKPKEVLKEMVDNYIRFGVSPGRGSYDLAVMAAGILQQTREKLARFFNAPDPERVIFTANATDALNMAIQGLLKPGDHVVSTCLEHNSVLRPLYLLRERDIIRYDLLPFDGQGYIDPQMIAGAVKPNTRLVIVSHASNVLGSIQPLREIGAICAARHIPLLVDAAQTAGYIPFDMRGWNIGLVAFTGHKALMGPAGIGGLILSPDVDIAPTRFGGTGMDSRSLRQPQEYPFRLEAGTHNFPGICGLSASLDYLERHSAADKGCYRSLSLAKLLYDGLSTLDGVTIHSPNPSGVPIVTCTVRGKTAGDIGDILDGDYQIAARTGLHCAPLVHEALGTAETGAVRFSPGAFNTREDIMRAVAAMEKIAAGA